jgi:hypothetical protein
MLKVLSLVVGVSIGVALFMTAQWYWYVTSSANPHDDTGTKLNEVMPGPMNAWGCEELRARFPQTTAPKGCRADDGVSWK